MTSCSRKTLCFLLSAGILAALPSCRTTSTNEGLNLDSALQDAAQDAGPEFALSLKESIYRRDNANPVKALQYAIALRETGQTGQAADVLEPFITQGTKDPDLLTEYASEQLTLGNYELAETNATRALKTDDDNGRALHVRAIALDALGQHKEAEASFRQALESWQGNPSPVLNNLGLNLAAQGATEEALATLRKAAELSPERADIRRNIEIVQALQTPKSAVQ